MRFYKHGDALGIVLPDKLRKGSSVRENDEYEFVQLEDKVFVLISKEKLEEKGKAAVVQLMQELVKSGVGAVQDSSPKANSHSPLHEPASQAHSSVPVRTASVSQSAKDSGASKPVESETPAPIGKIPAEPVQGAPEKAVFDNGFAVIEDEFEAKRVSKLLEKQIKAGEVMGVRAFDKKFYVISSFYYEKFKPAAISLLSLKQLTQPEVSSALGLSENGCNAVIQVLKDAGEVIETRRGLYRAV